MSNFKCIVNITKEVHELYDICDRVSFSDIDRRVKPFRIVRNTEIKYFSLTYRINNK